MCGILGFNHEALPKNKVEGTLKELAHLIQHRGPDDLGMFADDRMAMAMRRLAIIDLSNGNQPMSTFDGRLILIYNGETYNYRKLRESLKSKNYQFETDSDTEVVLNMFAEYGTDSFRLMNGMFGIAVYDKKNNTLVLARDRLGIKPLYYLKKGKRIVFGSELKTIVPFIKKPEIDYFSVNEYLRYGYIPGDKCIYRDAKKLLPGHWLKFSLDTGETTIQQYWDIQFSPDDEKGQSDWQEELHELIEDAVRIRMISDVPLGAFLSGGVDSSAISAFASKHSAQQLKTFSIGFEETECNELPYAKNVAFFLKTDHHEKVIKPEAAELLPKLIQYFDEPFADQSALPTYLVCKAAREHVTVALSGDGGDELFAGYSWIYRQYQQMKRFSWIPKTGPVADWDRANSAVAKAGRQLNDLLTDPKEAFLRKQSCFTTEMLENLINDPEEKHHPARIEKDTLEQALSNNACSFENSMLFQNFTTYLPEDILTKVDRMSMAVSLEARVPLLDYRVVELAAKIPFRLKLTDKGVSKFILKETIKSHLPPEVFVQRKQGFSIPIQSWFRGPLYDYAYDTILSGDFVSDNGFSRKYIENMLVKHKKGTNDSGHQIWSLLVCSLWYNDIFKKGNNIYDISILDDLRI